MIRNLSFTLWKLCEIAPRNFQIFQFLCKFYSVSEKYFGAELTLSYWPGIHASLGASWCDTLYTWAHQCTPSCVWIPDPNRFCLKKSVRILHEILILFIQFREGVSYQVWVYKTISNYYSEYLAVIDMKHVSSGKEQTLTSAFRAKRRFLSLMMQEKFYFMIHFFINVKNP